MGGCLSIMTVARRQPRGVGAWLTPGDKTGAASRFHAQNSQIASRPVSRVLYGPRRLAAARTWRPFVLDADCSAPHATYPGGGTGNGPEGFPSCHPYSVLLPVGFALPLLLPVARWALTPPFHPYHDDYRGGLLSVALSLGSPPPAINRHRVSMEPGLSSPAAFRLLLVRPPGRLAGRIKAFAVANASADLRQTPRSSSRSDHSQPISPRCGASPSRNSSARSGSCASRRVRHCI